MFIYGTVMAEDIGDGETGPWVIQSWLTVPARSAKDANRRVRKSPEKYGLRKSDLKYVSFTESEKLSGEDLIEAKRELLESSQMDLYYRL